MSQTVAEGTSVVRDPETQQEERGHEGHGRQFSTVTGQTNKEGGEFDLKPHTQAANEVLQAIWQKQNELLDVLCRPRFGNGSYSARMGEKNAIVRDITTLANTYRMLEGYNKH